MEDAIRAKLFGPGSPLEMVETTISYPDGKSPHQRGVKHMVFKNLPKNLVELYALPERDGKLDNEFIIYHDERFTYRKTMELAATLGHALKNELNVKKGDRVTICMKNSPEYVIAIIAATSIGAVAVPMNSWWETKELEYGLGNSDTCVVVCDSDRLARMKPVLSKLKSITKVLPIRSGKYGGPNDMIEAYEDIMARHSGAKMPDFPCEPDDNALIIYTSGTTGFPKGVVLTHRSVTHALNGGLSKSVLDAAIDEASGFPAPEQDPNAVKVSLLPVPIFHVTGLHAVVLLSFVVSRKLVLMTKWDATTALELIQKERVTDFTGVPTMVMELMGHPDFDKYDTSSINSIGGGGAPQLPKVATDIGKKFKQKDERTRPARTGYGMTETNALTVMSGGRLYLEKPMSCGRAVPGMTVEIWDDNNKKVPTGTPGRVMIKGAAVMKEYWNNPEATTKTITADGYLESGDIGKLDDQGFLFLLDRAKDIIIRGGENISCSEVEAAVITHPAVSDAGVVGVEHPTLGEEVGVAVVLKPGVKDLSLDSLLESCGQLSKFKKPVHLFFYPDQLPRGATGKTLKSGIREDIKAGKLRKAPAKSKL